ncbi:hypothetical protein AB0L71_15530 [Streptomyces sp. NPDC052052]
MADSAPLDVIQRGGVLGATMLSCRGTGERGRLLAFAAASAASRDIRFA